MTDMIKLYAYLAVCDGDKINGEIFNAGWETKTILQLAGIVRHIVTYNTEVVCSGFVPIQVYDTNDKRDYHISSRKIEIKLNFYPSFTVADMIKELIYIMNMGYVKDYSDKIYYNIKVLTGNNSD